MRKSFPGAPSPVLDGLDLEVPAGTLVHVTGPNGSGKTTLLRVVAGLLDPDAGTVAVAGVVREADRRAYQRRLAYVSSGNAGLYARLTVEHHLTIWGRMALVPREELRRRVAGALAAFGLAALRGRRVDRLSMGQRQRLRLALALLPASRLVLLDEPHTSLDAGGRAMLSAALEARLEMGAGVIWCSPEPEGDLAPDASLVLGPATSAPAR